MERELLISKVGEIIEPYMGYVEIDENLTKEDLDLDSLGELEIIADLEIGFNITISEIEIKDINTFKQLCDLIDRKVNK